VNIIFTIHHTQAPILYPLPRIQDQLEDIPHAVLTDLRTQKKGPSEDGPFKYLLDAMISDLYILGRNRFLCHLQ